MFWVWPSNFCTQNDEFLGLRTGMLVFSGFLERCSASPVQVRSGGNLWGCQLGVLWRGSAKEKAEVGAPAFGI